MNWLTRTFYCEREVWIGGIQGVRRDTGDRRNTGNRRDTRGQEGYSRQEEYR